MFTSKVKETLKVERERIKDEKLKWLYTLDQAVEKVTRMYKTRDAKIKQKQNEWRTRIDEAVKVVNEMKRARIESRKVYDVSLNDD